MRSPIIVLDEAAVKRLKKAVDTELDLLIWIGDWLSHLNMFSDAQVYDILKFIKPAVEAYEAEALAGNLRWSSLVICDSRWVSYSQIEDAFLDTKTSEIVKDLDDYAVTHIMCDVSRLRTRMRHRQECFNANGKNCNTPTSEHSETG